ncbi:hypothetical protein EW026_g176 [Hermanssonia centrifuga]|uniref:Uncharacterized protein n=1 Tax=Hermanssonia centrifuga TaxID=98765 RepID=A0A4S4KVF7_9APHY|nr:hypothetical protein EW026_g176 [Hermanssonia centrifuga]
MAAFSRLQLAKALIEYDNDNPDPDLPRRRAEESAIFAHLRRPPRQVVQAARRSTDYLGVTLPTDAGSINGGESISQHRKSQQSIDALRNPFGRDSTHEGHVDDDEIEVDLSSWGLDAFGAEKGSKKKKGKEEPLPNPYPPLQDAARRRPAASARTMSMGNLDNLGEGGAFLDAKSSVPIRPLGARRHSVGSPLDYADVEPTESALQHRRRASAHALIDSLPITPPLHSVPFPTATSVRSVSPLLIEGGPSALRPASRASLLDPKHGRTYSTASMGSRALLNEEEIPNPFAVRPPSPDRASRFDPKAVRARTVSTGTLGTQMLLNEPDAEIPESMSARSVLGDQPGRSRPYSRLELMRPKVLIMPSPLQGSSSQQPTTPAPEGFMVNTTEGPPLPPGGPSPTGFTLSPNPRNSMTLSQLTFRNTLMIDGQRDVAYQDIDDHLRRATEDGQQADLVAEETSKTSLPVIEEPGQHGRPAGRLYGKSLIDDLQARKAEMRGKQRVFTGDQRPSMMARTPMKRSSTLIDPESLKQRPVSRRLDSFQTTPDLSRRNSGGARKTLINFEDEIPGAPRGAHLGVDNLNAGGQTKSVFGVDTLWERELAKLKEIEAQEKEADDERKQREAEIDATGKKKKGKKRKGKGRDEDKPNDEGLHTSESKLSETSPVPDLTTGSAPGLSPVSSGGINKRGALKRPPPPPVDGDEDEEEESDSSSVSPRGQAKRPETNGWYSGSDDERKPRQTASAPGPVRTTGAGSRYPNLPPRLQALHDQGQLQLDDDDSSEEDLPLMATIERAAQRATRADLRSAADDSSDEDRPLTQLLDKTKLKLPTLSVGGSMFGSATKGGDESEEDEKPLGLRVSRLVPSSHALSSAGPGGEDDDLPLGLHPEQMRRSQFMMAAQVAQQQQMMMQAQMHQSMMFGAPSIMSAPFYGPPMAPPMMMAPQLPSTPPPLQDTTKLNRVDKWRHDVAVEGDQ